MAAFAVTVTRCDGGLLRSWQRLADDAAAAGTTCLSTASSIEGPNFCTACLVGIHDKDAKYLWAEALASKTATLNSTSISESNLHGIRAVRGGS